MSARMQIGSIDRIGGSIAPWRRLLPRLLLLLASCVDGRSAQQKGADAAVARAAKSSESIPSADAVALQAVEEHGTDRLDLAEQVGVELPPHFSPVGAFVTRGTPLLLWDVQGRVARVCLTQSPLCPDGPAVRMLRDVPSGIIGARWLKAAGHFEVVDSGSRSIVVFDSAGQQTDRRAFASAFVPRRAVFERDAWYLMGIAGDSTYQVVTTGSRGLAASSGSTTPVIPPSADPLDISGTARGLAVLPTVDWHAPTRIAREKGLQLRLEDDTAFARQIQAQPNALWRPLAPVALDDGFLQIIADLRSDRRLLVRFGAHGAPIRLQAVQAPIGFLGSVPEEQLLYAVRGGTPHLESQGARATNETMVCQFARPLVCLPLSLPPLASDAYGTGSVDVGDGAVFACPQFGPAARTPATSCRACDRISA